MSAARSTSTSRAWPVGRAEHGQVAAVVGASPRRGRRGGCGPRDPSSSPARLSRSRSPTPVITVRRGWRSSAIVWRPASITIRVNRTRCLSALRSGELRRTGPFGPGRTAHAPRGRPRPAPGPARRASRPWIALGGTGRVAPRMPPRPPSPGTVVQASLAQSAERFHGKEKVVGSIPTGGSPPAGACRPSRAPARRWTRRRSSVGESTRLIIEGSSVRTRPSPPQVPQPTQHRGRAPPGRSDAPRRHLTWPRRSSSGTSRI